MRDFVRQQTARLLDQFAEQLTVAARTGDADAIHDLRVSIRRLSRCLRVFAEFYPGRSWKKVRAQLSDLLHTAGIVRDRDIGLDLLVAAGVSKRAALAARLADERREASRELWIEIRRWQERNIASKWRRRLGL